MIEGRIIKNISNFYTVDTGKEKIVCEARGKFRKEKQIPLVGDHCKIDPEKKWIMEILPRKNELSRPSIANVDFAIIVTSMKKPDFGSFLLDKQITLVTLNHITPIIYFTKLDLLDKEEMIAYQNIKTIYQKIGYQVIEKGNYQKLEEILKGKIAVVTGQTGAGKSTLLNELNPALSLKTSPISNALNRGVHTTRHTEIYEIKEGYIADTPGFSSLDIKGYLKEEIKEAFIEFQNYSCRFKDCWHDKEKDCEIKKAVEQGLISKSRYDSYLKMLKEG